MQDQKTRQMVTELLDRGTVDVIDRKHLTQRLERGDRLRVKLGIDPTGSDLHLGHTVALRKLRQFQKYGHTAVLIIGDWTARIGDPSGRKATRPPLSPAEVQTHAARYLEQISVVLDLDRAEVCRQSEWFDAFTLQTIIELMGKFTVQQLLQREDFRERMDAKLDVRFHEPLYCLLQGYDSVPVKADLELGGNDQLFNLLKGREVQQIYSLPPQDVLTVPLLIGLDGKQKMGKSLNNYIGIFDPPIDMYGKAMSIPDDLIVHYFTLATDVPVVELKDIEDNLTSGVANPRDLKARLAREIVMFYHGIARANDAEAEFNRVFRAKETPSAMPEVALGQATVRADELLLHIGLAPSKAEAQRLIRQGGVSIAGTVVSEWRQVLTLNDMDVVQVGKRRFVKVRVAK